MVQPIVKALIRTDEKNHSFGTPGNNSRTTQTKHEMKTMDLTKGNKITVGGALMIAGISFATALAVNYAAAKYPSVAKVVK